MSGIEVRYRDLGVGEGAQCRIQGRRMMLLGY